MAIKVPARKTKFGWGVGKGHRVACWLGIGLWAGDCLGPCVGITSMGPLEGLQSFLHGLLGLGKGLGGNRMPRACKDSILPHSLSVAILHLAFPCWIR